MKPADLAEWATMDAEKLSDRLAHSDIANIYNEHDLIDILRARDARIRAAALEEAAKTCDGTPLEWGADHVWYVPAKQQRLAIAAAVRALK